MSIDFRDLLKRLKKKREKQRNENEEDGEEYSDYDNDEQPDVHVLGISVDVWAYSILCYFDMYEVLKFFHVSGGFYVIACLALQNRKANSDRILRLVMDKDPAEVFLLKLLRWNCFDKILNPHIFRNAVRKGYFQVVRFLHLQEGCNVKEWSLDIIEQMCIHLEKSEEDNEEMFEGYIGLLEEFKNDIDWDELQSPEGFNIICGNKEMHEYVKSRYGKKDEKVNYNYILEVSCEFEYMNSVDYFLKHNVIKQKCVSQSSIFESFIKVVSKDRSRSRNRSKLFDTLLPHVDISSQRFLEYFHTSIDDTKKYEDLSLLILRKTEEFKNLSLEQVRYHPIFTDYCKYLERDSEEEENEEGEIVSPNNNDIIWYGVLNRVSSKKFLKSPHSSYYVEADYYREKEGHVTQFVQTILNTFTSLDPRFDGNIMLKNSLMGGNLKLVKFLLSEDPQYTNSSPVLENIRLTKKEVFTISHFGFSTKEGLDNVSRHKDEIINNYLEIMKILVKHNEYVRYIQDEEKKKMLKIDLTNNGSNKAYKSLYFLSDYLYGNNGKRLKRMMAVMEGDEDVMHHVKKYGEKYPKKVDNRFSWIRRPYVRPVVNNDEDEDTEDDDWDSEEDW